ncbi:MucBP domain-containing protein [Streptococcus jiangjianxini]|uniref:MucBP domain-containing protein n=1 Tax=Streptococcus jiangjianxini TaxID=3161189 RepID=UPI0032EEA275
MFFKQKQRFSIRKYSFGAASVLLGTVLLGLAGPDASANTLTKDEQPASAVASPTPEQEPVDQPETGTTTTEVASEEPVTDNQAVEQSATETSTDTTAAEEKATAPEAPAETAASEDAKAEQQSPAESTATVESATTTAPSAPAVVAPVAPVPAATEPAAAPTTTEAAPAEKDSQTLAAELEALKVKTEAAISGYNLLSDAVKASYVARLKETTDLAVLELLAQEAKKAQRRAETFPSQGQTATSMTGFRAIPQAMAATAPTAEEVADTAGWEVLKRFSNKPGIFYVQKSGTVNGGDSTDKSTLIYEVDSKTGKIVEVSKDDFEGGGTLYENLEKLSKEQNFTEKPYKVINALGLSNDGRYAYAIGFTSDITVTDRTTINAIYRYDMQTKQWSIASDASKWPDGMGVMTTNAWTAGAVNPKDGKYYFGTLTLKTDPAFSQVAPGTEKAYQEAKANNTFDLYFRMWSFDPATGTVANAGYLDTNLVKSGSFDKNETYFKQQESYVVGNDIAFDTEGNMKLIMNQYSTGNYYVYSVKSADFDAATAKNDKYSKIEGQLSGAIPIATDITDVDATNTESLQKENGVTTGGLAIDADGSLLFHSRQGKVGLIRPDLKYGGILTNVTAPTSTKTWGDAASIRGTVGTGNVYREYYIKGTDTILSGTVGTIEDFRFVPSLKTTTGTDTIEKEQALYHEYNAANGRPEVIRAADGTVYRYVGVKAGSDPETGTVKKEDQTVKYEYQPVEITGNVIVTYVDVNGNEIKDPVDDEKNADAGEPYNTDVDRKLELIKGKDGKTYELVTTGKYEVGEVDGNGHLTSSDETVGKVEPGTTKKVTYVYREVPTQKTGDVVLHYVDIDGNVLQPNHHNSDDKPVGKDYAVTEKEKPKTIEKDGVIYKLVETIEEEKIVDGKSTTGIVNGEEIATEQVTTVEEGPDAKIKEGTQNIVYVYKPVGSVVIHYVNTKGQVIKEKVIDTTDGDIDADYNAAEKIDNGEEKPATITNGNVKYNFKEVATTNKVGGITVAEIDAANVVGTETGKVVKGTTHVIYVYEEEASVPTPPEEVKKGSVTVKYEDTEGNQIKSPVKDTDNEPVGTKYETTDNKYDKVKGDDGSTYYITENPVKAGSNDEKGTVEEGEKVVTYVYEKAGAVEVKYVDETGKEIKATVEAVKDAKPGSDYDTTTATLRPAKITGTDGKAYELVPADDYTVGKVDENGHLTTTDTVSGQVEAGKTKSITYVYREVKEETPTPPETPKTGSVIVSYVDTDGNSIKAPVFDEKNQPDGTPYNTADDNRPKAILADNGNIYELVEKGGNYNVGDVDDFGALTKPAEGQPWKADPESGTVSADTIKSVTYVYKLKEDVPTPPEEVKKGSVTVKYEDTEGNQIKSPVKDTDNEPVGTKYETTDNKHDKVKGDDGSTYYITEKAVKDNSDDEKGLVEEREKVVTYVYEKAGAVEVKYVDETGKEIKATVEAVKDAKPGSDYDTTTATLRPSQITDQDGKVYELVPQGTYDAGTVDANGHLITTDTVNGQVEAGKTKSVTYVYKLKEEVPTPPETPKTGSVVVHYVNTDGEVIQSAYKDTTDAPVDSPYNAAEGDLEKPKEIRFGGKTYKFKEVSDSNTVNGKEVVSITDTDFIGPEANKVFAGTTHVVYVYEEVKEETPTPPEAPKYGSVVVHYKDEEGNTIAEDKVDTQDSKVDTPYNTTDNRPEKITTEDGKTYERVPDKTVGNEEGKVTEGKTEVTYVYKEVKGNVIVHYIDTEGNVIADDAEDTPETSTGTAYDTSDDHMPPTITKDGVKYELVPALTKGNEQGKVVEGTTEVTYVYKKVEEPTTPEVPEEKPGKYIPYIPQDPSNPTDPNDPLTPPTNPNGDPVDPVDYDETPEDPSDNPPLPHVPGYEPKDPKDPTGKTPLKPVDPNDPTKGYIPPTITDPNDPTKDTPVPYTPVGSVVVRYKDTDGNVIKEQVTDTPTSDVDTPYSTTDHKPETITYKGDKYVLVPSKTEGEESGKVVKGETVVTYVYQKVGNWIPEIPGVPGKDRPEVPYPFDPENPDSPVDPTKPNDPDKPGQPPVIPHVPGYIPNDPDGNPLKPVDPEDPTKGYVPPVPSNPGEDTHIPYVPAPKDPENPDTPDTPDVPDTEEPGSYIPYVPKDPKNPDPNDPDGSIEIPKVPYDETPEDPSDNPPLPHVPGYEPKDPTDPTGKTPLKPVDPNDPTKGYIPPTITDPNDPTKDTPVPYTPVGSVVVRYKDTDGNVIKEQVTDTPTSDVDTPYSTTDHKPETITYKGDKYVLVPSKTEGEESGKVVKGETVVTYVYQKVGNWIPEIPGVPNEDRPEIPYPFDPENPNDPVNPNDPSTPPIPHVPGYTPNDPDGNPLKPVDPNDPTKGYIPPVPSNPGEDTHIPYVPNTPEDPDKPDTPDVPEVPDTEEPGSYIPYVPKDPKNPDPNDPDGSIEIPKVPYDETPEDPSDNPPLPHVPGYEPKDPTDPTGKTPLKPVDPNDPTKGYIPPTITDPNDPTKDTPVPYTPVGSVVVRYKDTDGNVIKEQETDTPTSDVDTPYDTTDHKPKEITYKGDKYVLVPSKTEGEESGKVVKGETVVTYVYQKVGNWIPEIPGVPNEDRPEIPYPFDPENPNDPVNPNDPSTPPIPHVPGYTPNDPDGNPLKPVDPNDPTKGYIPPVPSNPGEDTHIPYVPNTPEDPEKPDTPDVPNTPEDPEKPDTPDVPNTPEDPEKPDTPDVPNTPEDPEKPGTPDMPDTPDVPKTPESPESPESPVTPTASTRRNDSDKYMAKGVENLPNTGETSNYLAAAYGGMAIGLAALLASKKRKRDSED